MLFHPQVHSPSNSILLSSTCRYFSILTVILTKHLCFQRILDFSYSSQVNNPIVRGVLQHCTRLQVLELDACRHVTDQAFQPDYSPFCPLRACTSLKRLSIAKCSQITEKGLFLIAKTCSALIDLNVSYCRVRIPLKLAVCLLSL